MSLKRLLRAASFEVLSAVCIEFGPITDAFVE